MACITDEFACITRRQRMIYQKSLREIPEQLATITSKEHHGAHHGDKRSYTEGVRMLKTSIKILRFLSQYNTLSPLKSFEKPELPL